VQRLDQDRSRWPAEGGQPADELVDQLVRELADEVALPVVPVDAVAGIENTLLGEEGKPLDSIADEARRRAELPELTGLAVRARVAGGDGEAVHSQLRLDTEVAPGTRNDVAVVAEDVGDTVPRVLEQAADDLLEWMEAVLQLGCDAEVAAPAAEAPEELGILLGVGADHVAAGGDKLGADQVVAGEPVLGGQVADPAAEGEACDTGRADDPARGDQAVGLGRRVEVGPGCAARGAGYPSVGIDLHPAHLGEIDDEAVIQHAVPGGVVATAPDGDLELMRPGEVEGGGDVAGAKAAGDRSWAAVDQEVEADAGGVVVRVGGGKDVAVERLSEFGEVLRRDDRTSRARGRRPS
jgi:hypothetical protein